MKAGVSANLVERVHDDEGEDEGDHRNEREARLRLRLPFDD